jgi:hypothetical protein
MPEWFEFIFMALPRTSKEERGKFDSDCFNFVIQEYGIRTGHRTGVEYD